MSTIRPSLLNGLNLAGLPFVIDLLLAWIRGAGVRRGGCPENAFR
jgi:hypothetical protein